MKFTGVLPALVTPLDQNENLNVNALYSLIAHLLNQDADGFYIGGATGEGIALRPEVREALAYESVKAVGGKKPCIIHIASADFDEALSLACQAEKCGADAISAIPPIFFQYDEQCVFDYYKKIAESVNIPLMVYFNPAAGFNMTADFAAKLFEIDNVTAIKWTSSNYFGMLRLRDLTNGEMSIANGPDEMLLMGLAAGADCGIGMTYNFMLPKIKKIYDSFTAGSIDAARQAQAEANRIINTVITRPIIPATKLILHEQGFDVGECVFPMKRFTENESRAFIKELNASGLEI